MRIGLIEKGGLIITVNVSQLSKNSRSMKTYNTFGVIIYE